MARSEFLELKGWKRPNEDLMSKSLRQESPIERKPKAWLEFLELKSRKPPNEDLTSESLR